MSNFRTLTRRKGETEWREADWIDDAFGRHNYGVRFVGKTLIENARIIEFETKNVEHVEQDEERTR